MGLFSKDLRDVVIVPVLRDLDLYSDAAVNLLLGTASQESQLTHLTQLGGGPALGIYQMEPATYADLLNWLSGHWQMSDKLNAYRIQMNSQQLAGNLYLATACCRLQYYRDPEPLPARDDFPGLARYWKRVWNTPAGKGSAMQFMQNLDLVRYALL